MATDSCPDCKYPISKNAAVCPHCGCPRSPEREQLYTALVNIRNTELSVYWTRYNIQAVLNVGFAGFIISALVELRDKHDFQFFVLRLSLVVVGIMLAVVWYGFIVLGKRLFTEGWENRIAEYEKLWLMEHYEPKRCKPGFLFYNLKDANAISPIEKRRLVWLPKFIAWDNLNLLSRVLPFLFIVGWFGFGLIVVYKFI